MPSNPPAGDASDEAEYRSFREKREAAELSQWRADRVRETRSAQNQIHHDAAKAAYSHSEDIRGDRFPAIKEVLLEKVESAIADAIAEVAQLDTAVAISWTDYVKAAKLAGHHTGTGSPSYLKADSIHSSVSALQELIQRRAAANR